MLKKEIIDDLRHFKDVYDLSSEEDITLILYKKIAGFFNKIECWLYQTNQETELHAYKHVE